MQDVPFTAYTDEESFLMQRQKGVCGYNILPTGELECIFNESKLTDTLENTVISVMKEEGKPLELYIPEEHRIYANEHCLNAHKKYIKALQKGEINKVEEFNV